MACGPLTTRRCTEVGMRLLVAIAALTATLCGAKACAEEVCPKPVYLTIDTGHMGVAPLIIDVLKRQRVKATFFLANERTQAVGDKAAGTTLDGQWAPWWKALAADRSEEHTSELQSQSN